MGHFLKTLIADDEPIARKVLREELEQLPEVIVVGEAENGTMTGVKYFFRSATTIPLLMMIYPGRYLATAERARIC